MTYYRYNSKRPKIKDDICFFQKEQAMWVGGAAVM